ncbi:hypothetical protein C8Q72DRAFT_149746 [Fomitopsis betulina]|nr:hypothetical protein C8Q72DRAFT_149746 [Fomitopsis betulina]
MPARKTMTASKHTGRQARANASRTLAMDDDQVDEIQDDQEGQEGDENGMLEMLSMLQEFQKKKASKSSSRAIAFQTKKTALFTDARATVDTIVREGAAYLDQYKAGLIALKAQELSQNKHLQELSALWKNQDETVDNLRGMYPSLIEDLSHRRSAQINDASESIEAHAEECQESRKKLIHLAKARADEILERQKLATDATALIKHYKALLLV